MQLTDVGIISHLIACVGFVALAISVVMRPQRDGASSWLIIAALITAAWGGDFVLTARLGGGYAALLSPMETLRTAAWIGFLVALLRTSWALDERLSSSFVIASTIGFVTAIKLGLDLVDAFGSGATSLHDAPIVAALFVVGRLTVAIPGLVLIHNLYVNAEPASGTGIRLLCIGLAGFFVYDLNLYTLRFLLGSMSSDLFNIRGAIDAITVPLLLLSARQAWVARVQVSRQVVFHTLSMSIIGGYLIVMALTAYGLRLVGGDWGRLLQITFLFATIILGAIILVLPRCRSMLRLLISKHFFAYRYDYRTEWLRFIKTVSGIDAGSTATHRGRIPSLAARHGDFKGFTPAALTALNDWHWPGNVRELENKLKRAVIMAENSLLDAANLDLGGKEAASLNLKFVREDADRKAIRLALARTEGKLSTTSKLLWDSRPTLYDLLKQYGIDA